MVGDRFLDFSTADSIITLSQLRALLHLPSGLVTCAPMLLVPGQGLGEEDIDGVLAQAAISPQQEVFDFTLWREMPKRACSALSHKHRAENTLISTPRKIDDVSYELDLLIDENSELMGDHQTGQHIQGMILAEAARQAFLAVTEVFFLPDSQGDHYFVFNSMTAKYERFVFPLPAVLRYHVCHEDLSGSAHSFSVEILVEQAGKRAASIACAFSVMKDRSVRKLERTLAREALNAHFSSLTAAASAGAFEPAYGTQA